jgi:hypothetical protein
MVYLNDILKQNKARLCINKNIELAAYLFISSPSELSLFDFELTFEEEIALQGYKNESVEVGKIISIISKTPRKGISALSNIYKFAGLYLAAKDELNDSLNQKYSQGDLKQKYFLSKVETTLINQLASEVLVTPSEPYAIIISKILGSENIIEAEIDQAIQNIVQMEIDVQTQILLEDLLKTLLKTKYTNKTCEEVVRDVLNNFSNAIQKIIRYRRKGHMEFKIEDEYDVQDILYVILKSFFPLLRDEDPIAKVGAKSTKIDLILREEMILIEVKMLKEKDNNEVEFIEQLKKDFESYHQCQWLTKLFCFVYDPYKKTRDLANFNDLNGDRTKQGHSFNVEIIVSN